jgi:MoaD family protein
MRVTIKVFSALREVVGVGKIERELEEDATVQQLLDVLYTEFPGLKEFQALTIISVNQEFASRDKRLQEGDEVALFPPVSGGSGWLKITRDPIVVDEVVRSVVYPHTGAVATFVGTVRDVSHGRQVTHLEYEAYQEMAINKLRQLADEIRAQWPEIVDVAIVQRVGRVEVGETAAVIAVSSSHRDDGCFEASRYAIDRLKQIVPIWKKEVGPDGDAWIEGDFVPSSEVQS